MLSTDNQKDHLQIEGNHLWVRILEGAERGRREGLRGLMKALNRLYPFKLGVKHVMGG